MDDLINSFTSFNLENGNLVLQLKQYYYIIKILIENLFI